MLLLKVSSFILLICHSTLLRPPIRHIIYLYDTSFVLWFFPHIHILYIFKSLHGFCFKITDNWCHVCKLFVFKFYLYPQMFYTIFIQVNTYTMLSISRYVYMFILSYSFYKLSHTLYTVYVFLTTEISINIGNMFYNIKQSINIFINYPNCPLGFLI